MCDATGIGQFISAVAELARGLPSLTITPAWSRELLEACSPPRPMHHNNTHDVVLLTPAPSPDCGDLVTRAFTFTRADIAAIKEGLPPLLRYKATTFEVVAAAIWRGRVVALDPPAGDHMRLAIIVNVRRLRDLGLPAGYYGNAIVAVMATATVGALRDGSLGDAVELVRDAKALVTAEYMRSEVDLIVLRGRPSVSPTNLLVVSDCRHAGLYSVDFGWGEPVYGGPVHTHHPVPALFSSVKNGDGEDVLVVPLTLPRPAMDRFVLEIEMLVKGATCDLERYIG